MSKGTSIPSLVVQRFFDTQSNKCTLPAVGPIPAPFKDLLCSDYMEGGFEFGALGKSLGEMKKATLTCNRYVIDVPPPFSFSDSPKKPDIKTTFYVIESEGARKFQSERLKQLIDLKVIPPEPPIDLAKKILDDQAGRAKGQEELSFSCPSCLRKGAHLKQENVPVAWYFSNEPLSKDIHIFITTDYGLFEKIADSLELTHNIAASVPEEPPVPPETALPQKEITGRRGRTVLPKSAWPAMEIPSKKGRGGRTILSRPRQGS